MPSWTEIAVSGLIAVFGGRSVWDYIRDRRKNNAEGEVASATVELQIDAKRLENAEARLVLTQKAWDEERHSFERRIERLESELQEERLESERKDGKILELETRVSEIQTQLLDVTRDLADLRRTGP